MAKQKYPIRKLQRRLNQVTLLIVLGVGLLAMMTMVSEPGRMKFRPPDRDIASVENTPLEIQEPNKVTSVLSLACDSNSEAVSSSQQVRLKGHLCQSDLSVSILSTQIENKRNGYIATVFHQDKEFSTDFIQLSEGENQLLVKHMLSDGKIEEHSLVVNRQ